MTTPTLRYCNLYGLNVFVNTYNRRLKPSPVTRTRHDTGHTTHRRASRHHADATRVAFQSSVESDETR